MMLNSASGDIAQVWSSSQQVSLHLPHHYCLYRLASISVLLIVTVHGSVCSFCVRLCGWTRSLCLSALPSNRAPDEVIRTVTGVARLHCLYLAGVSVVRCQIVFTLVVSYSLCQSSRSGGCSRLVVFQYFLKAGDSALPGLLHLYCQ